MSLPTVLDNGVAVLKAGSIAPTINRDYVRDRTGTPWLIKERWDLDIRAIKPEGGSLDSGISNIETMFENPFRKLILFDKDGNQTVHSILEDTSLGDIQVVSGPSYVKVTRGELVTVRNATVSIEAVFPHGTKLANDVVDFDESVNIVPAGETKAMVQPNVGYGTIQTTRTNRHGTVVQSGTVTYYGTYGAIPPPLLSPAFQTEPVKVTRKHPMKFGRGSRAAFVGYTQDYSYTFITPGPVNVVPTKWND